MPNAFDGDIYTSPVEKPMTVDELLSKLGEEYGQIAAELPKWYEQFGQVLYPQVINTITGVYASDAAYEKDQISKRVARQEEIKNFRWKLMAEKRKATEA
jgi:hypothetical protein